MRMIASRDFIVKISQTISELKAFVPGVSPDKLVDVCIEELEKLGYLVPIKDSEKDGYSWTSWIQDEELFFDFIAYSDTDLILGECRLYRDEFVPVEQVKKYVERITKVKPQGKRITGLFISNRPLNSEGMSLLHSIEDVTIETIIS